MVQTRSQRRLNQEEDVDMELPTSGRSGSSQRTNSDELYSREICESFVAHPYINPRTGKSIAILGPKFFRLNGLCKSKYDIEFDVNKYIKDELDRDLELGQRFIASITRQGSLNVIKVKNVFKDETKLVNVSSLPYLEYAYNYVNTEEYKNKLIDIEFNIIKDNKISLLQFVNYVTYDTNGIFSCEFRYRGITHKVKPNTELFNRIVENAKRNGIVIIRPYPVLYHAKFNLTIIGEDVRLTNYEDDRNTIVEQFILKKNPNLAVLNEIINTCEKILQYNYTREVNTDDFKEILNELLSIRERLTLPKSKSITEPSTAKSNNRSKSISSSKQRELPPLEKKTRAELLEDVLAHSKESMDVITFRQFSAMKKKDLQLIIRIGPRTRDGKYSSYNVVSIYKKIAADVKSNLIPKDPLNPNHIITSEEMIRIQEAMQYYKRGLPRPDNIKKYGYPKVSILFDPDGMYPVRYNNFIVTNQMHPGFYSFVVRHTIGTRSTDKIWGVIPDVDAAESGEPDLTTGVIIEAIRKLQDEGRLLVPNYLNDRLQFYMPRIHLNKAPSYWETERINKLRHMKREIENYYRFNETEA